MKKKYLLILIFSVIFGSCSNQEKKYIKKSKTSFNSTRVNKKRKTKSRGLLNSAYNCAKKITPWLLGIEMLRNRVTPVNGENKIQQLLSPTGLDLNVYGGHTLAVFENVTFLAVNEMERLLMD